VIHDSLSQAARYAGLHPLFPVAFAWLEKHADAADGKHHIRGDELFVIVETAATHDAGQRRFEAHRRYIDIQVNLAGGEVMEWLPVSDLRVEDDFQPDGDIAFYHAPAIGPSRLHVRPREFTIFFPSDAHKPVCHPPSGPTTYRKFVFKVDVRATGG
jgi:biofilm protein TabA